MSDGVDTFTAERVAELRKNIDFSDSPEITDFSGFWLRRDRLSGKVKPRLVQGEDGQLVTVFD